MNASSMRVAATCALLATTCLSAFGLAAPAFAQSAADFRNLDANGVDLVRGDFVLSFTEGTIGSGPGALSLVRQNGGQRFTQWEGITFRRTVSGSNATIDVGMPGGLRSRFTGSASLSTFTPDRANGSTLTRVDQDYVHTAADGTQIVFIDPTGSYDSEASSGGSFCARNSQPSCDMLPATITSPNGRVTSLSWDTYAMPDGTGGTTYEWRLAGVANSFGYSIAFSYQDDSFIWGSQPSIGWRTRSGAAFRNDAVGPTVQGSVSYAYPSAPSSYATVDVTDVAGAVWRVTGDSIRRPGESAPGFSVTRGAGGTVTSVTRDGVTTGYALSVAGSTGTMVVTDAVGETTRIESDLAIGRPTKITDALNRVTQYAYDASARLSRVTAPEENATEYIYDARGNVVETRLLAKPGSTAAVIATFASYAASCTNIKTCNSPVSTTDAGGKVTEYTYDGTHGGVTSVTAPASTPGAVRPETRYAYALVNGEYMPTGMSACRTLASCTDGADEVRSTIGYDANGNVVSAATGSGDGSLTATSAITYTPMGDIATVDGPLVGPADTVRYRYDAARRQVGVVSPDPDGAGPLKPRAIRNAIGAGGQVTRQESGTVASQSDADWTAFAPLEAVETGYDANLRPVTSKLVAGGTVHALTQQSYDALGRADCTAQRMNPAVFGALPPSACDPGVAGAFGADRIVKSVYDKVGRPKERRVAVGTPEEAAEAAATYSANGQIETLVDGENNKTTYLYDGHNRLSRTLYPVTAKGDKLSNPDDYEELTYDVRSLVTSRRLRDGKVIGFTYDALGRLVGKDVPNLAFFENDASYAYDNLGRLTGTTDGAGLAITIAYDALGRKTSEGSNWYGTARSQYDITGRRTRLTWRDGFYVTYDHLVTGEMTGIKESSGFAVARFSYDDLGRRTSLTRGNGTSTSYAYDPVSRLSSLGQAFATPAQNLVLGFGYNPAGQIVEHGRSNDAYSFTGTTAGQTDFPVNGLNQQTGVGAMLVTHDARGNFTSDGARTFGYTTENRLANVSGASSTNLAYDPLGRLIHLDGSMTDFRYDGSEVIEESVAFSGAPRKRFVHGPGVDEPLVSYDASGNRRYLHADERGSIVATSDQSGNTVAVAKYDEYGVPEGQIADRFGYTGQMWLPEVGVYSYKARMYDPWRGRFLQTDPIGYGDGMNLYAYVKGDPISNTDPTGSTCYPVVVRRGYRWVFVATGLPVPGMEEEGVSSTKEEWCDNGNVPLGRETLRSMGPGGVSGRGGRARSRPQSSRPLTAREKRIIRCNGASQASVDSFNLSDGLPPAFYLNPNVDAVTLPGAPGQSTAHFRNGISGMTSSRDYFELVAHEFGHHLQFRQGLNIGRYLSESWDKGYTDNMYEVISRDFAASALSNWDSGKCR